jgi:hypothetical protein
MFVVVSTMLKWKSCFLHLISCDLNLGYIEKANAHATVRFV